MKKNDKTADFVALDSSGVPWLMTINHDNGTFVARRNDGVAQGRIIFFYPTEGAITIENKAQQRLYIKLARMTTVSPKFPLEKNSLDTTQRHRRLTNQIRT